MPTWKGLLSPEQIEDLWQYVNARSSGKLAPGRPTRPTERTHNTVARRNEKEGDPNFRVASFDFIAT